MNIRARLLISRPDTGGLWVVLSDPEQTGGRIVMVQILKFIDPISDDTCIIEPGEIKGWMERLCVRYVRWLIADARRIAEAIDAGLIGLRGEVSVELMRRILVGARGSMKADLVNLILSPDQT